MQGTGVQHLEYAAVRGTGRKYQNSGRGQGNGLVEPDHYFLPLLCMAHCEPLQTIQWYVYKRVPLPLGAYSPFVRAFTCHLLNTYHMPGTVLRVEISAKNKSKSFVPTDHII